jgi:predicted HAD superfamily Cof-like phosphohydrolase
MTNFEKLSEFHEKFSVVIGSKGHLCTDERALLRARIMMEELAELVEAMQLHDYPQIAKELCDVLYVVYGTGLEYGIPVDEVFAEVHKSNMTKTPTTDAGGKIMKGPDYEPPDIKAVLDKVFRGGNS